ncbi:TetR/AcrR family transcriptional regulator [Shimia sp.]|uniref:TetR/AcrR family transcriptional regulator n=1 Tax=Shimia sp. TaxID=1954381 RepID=UPI003B8C027A
MPKIVDHDSHRAELALRAASYFSEHGYGGVSMRKIAAYLGVSKSALYHYFPTKEALFLASTEAAMQAIPAPDALSAATPEEQMAQLSAAMAPSFGAEMALLFDYLRGKTAAEIAADDAMQLALSAYRSTVAGIVGDDAADDALDRLLGRLLMGYFRGASR